MAYSIWEIYFTVGKAEHNVKQAGRSAGKASKNIKKRKKKERKGKRPNQCYVVNNSIMINKTLHFSETGRATTRTFTEKIQ